MLFVIDMILVYDTFERKQSTTKQHQQNNNTFSAGVSPLTLTPK
jgi:hypothetical protein